MFKKLLMMCYLIMFAILFPTLGQAQNAPIEESFVLEEKTFSDIEIAQKDAFKPYLATSQLNIQLCGQDSICQGLAEEYISTYFLVHKQCARVLEEDRLLCQQFQGDCSTVPEDAKDMCEVYMDVNIEKAQEMELDKEWAHIEDFIVDIALLHGYLENDIQACSKIIQKHIDPLKSQYYACDIVFANNMFDKIDEIIEIRQQETVAEDIEEDLDADFESVSEEDSEVLESSLEAEPEDLESSLEEEPEDLELWDEALDEEFAETTLQVE